MKLIDGHFPPEWDNFHKAVTAEQQAKHKLKTAQAATNRAILRATSSGRVTLRETAEVLNVSESTARNRRNNAKGTKNGR